MVQLRQEGVVPPHIRRVQGLGPQNRRLWRRVARDCGWKHPKAPAVRNLWKEGATEAALEFLGEVWAGCWQTMRVMVPVEAESEGAVSEGEEGSPGPP